MRRKRITSLVLSVCLIVGSAVQGGAATTQEKISNAKAQQQANQSSLQQTQEKIQELESIEEIRAASEEELGKVPSMNRQSAQKVYQFFHS